MIKEAAGKRVNMDMLIKPIKDAKLSRRARLKPLKRL